MPCRNPTGASTTKAVPCVQVTGSEDVGTALHAEQRARRTPGRWLELSLKALGEADLLFGKWVRGANFRAVDSEGPGRVAFLRPHTENMWDHQALEAWRAIERLRRKQVTWINLYRAESVWFRRDIRDHLVVTFSLPREMKWLAWDGLDSGRLGSGNGGGSPVSLRLS